MFLSTIYLEDGAVMLLDDEPAAPQHHQHAQSSVDGHLSAPKSATTNAPPAWRDEWHHQAAAPPSKRACQGKGLLLRHACSDASSQDDEAEAAPSPAAKAPPPASAASLNVMIDNVVEAELTCSSGACSMDSCMCIASTTSSGTSSGDAPAQQLLTYLSAIALAAAEPQEQEQEGEDAMAAARSCSSGASTDSLMLPSSAAAAAAAAAAAQQQCEAAPSGTAFSEAFQRLCYFGAQDDEQAAWLRQLQDQAGAAKSPFAAFAFLPL